MIQACPARLQLSRRKGFRLQEQSRAVNGLPAVNVARPSKWGNPAVIGSYFMVGDPNPAGAGIFRMSWCIAVPEAADGRFTYVEDDATAVRLFRQLADSGYFQTRTRPSLDDLHGKNLACWCPLDAPCHADVLLDIANGEPS